ncbi:hypothetical protein [Chromobacterium sp. LK11]|uniref:hypothetical protein n=1 Tax=Chromobacterium sp. LK11 TaxID=1628212 RepID=UPI000B184364|nr:hypothetical protein [Chromobacterium sp. LK11]
MGGLGRLSDDLSEGEVDALKYTLSLLSVKELFNGFEIGTEREALNRFYEPLRLLATIQPFSERVPPYGIVYRGRPDFMTDALLDSLKEESDACRVLAVPATLGESSQYIYQPISEDNITIAEQLAASDVMLALVQQYAGAALPSFMTSYIYYDCAGQSSPPHVDNAFTAITVMLGLRHECERGTFASRSVVYWPDQSRLDYQLKPGELSIFFGVSTLHGRTPVDHGEKVQSLLLSFRPLI